MTTCTGTKKGGGPCGMRPKAGETLCMNCKRKASSPAPAAEERALMPGEQPEPKKKRESNSSAGDAGASSSSGSIGELVAGALVGLVVVAGAAWALFSGSAKAST